MTHLLLKGKYYYYFIIILDPKGSGFDLDMLFSQENYVAIYEATIHTKLRPQYSTCEIISVANYDVKNVVWAFQKDSEYLSLFNHYLKAMEEKGISKQILEKWESTPPTCQDLSGKPLELNSCFTGFFPLFAGGLLAIFMLVIEIFAYKSFGVDISKYYENVAADAVQMCCDNCGIDLNSNH